MEIRINLVLMAALGLAWAGLTAAEPVAALDPGADETRHLAILEDAFAQDRSDPVLARELAERYLEIEQPGLAVATIRAADPALLEDPLLAHRLAQAYEKSGRVLDAMATADLALARCARSLGAAGVSGTPVPRYNCSERHYAVLDMHRTALVHMVQWGVAEPDHDARARVAYDLALRRARVASY
jgi:hypothetical protein